MGNNKTRHEGRFHYVIRYKSESTFTNLYLARDNETKEYSLSRSSDLDVLRFPSIKSANRYIKKFRKSDPELGNMLEVAYNL